MGWFERIVLLATFASILLASLAFWIDYNDRIEARRVNAATLTEIAASHAARREEAIARAWTTLTTPAPGNSDKREAMEYLAAQGVSLSGIDLSCERMGADWSFNLMRERMECNAPTALTRLSLPPRNGQGAVLRGANLSGSDLRVADLRQAILVETNLFRALFASADLRSANFADANLRDANLYLANLEGAFIAGADLSGAYLISANLLRANLWNALLIGVDVTNANFREANLSGADFTGTIGQGQADFSAAWTWHDQPPIGLDPRVAVVHCQFDPTSHIRTYRPEPCIAPPD